MIARLVATLAPFEPYMRGAPRGLPFRFDEDTVRRGLNFTLTTSLGDLDLLGETPSCWTYSAESFACWTHPKDLEAIAELEGLLAERER